MRHHRGAPPPQLVHKPRPQRMAAEDTEQFKLGQTIDFFKSYVERESVLVKVTSDLC